MIAKRRKRGRTTPGRLLLSTTLFVVTAACSTGRSEGVDVASLPDSVRGDYELFAVRCSKCHSLARPLESGITDDAFWKKYVERMRRQPASGISPSDEIPILRFLHYYSADKQRRAPAAAPVTAPPSTPAPAPTPDSSAAPGPAPDAPTPPEPAPEKELPP